MWKASKRLVTSCMQSVFRCNRRNSFDIDDLDDISEYDVQDVPVAFEPQTFAMPVLQRHEELQHRPDAPGVRRCSPPELLAKIRQALEEMSQLERQAISEKARGDHPIPFDELPQTPSSPKT